MSYLQGPDLPSFKKAIISFWFRVPQASIDAAVAAYKGDGSLFDGIIPLVVMGIPGSGQTPYTITDEKVLTGIQKGFDVVGLSSTQTIDVPPPTNFIEDGDTRCLIHGPFSAFCTVVKTENLDAHYVPGTDYSYTTVPTTSAAGDAPPTLPSFIGLQCSAPSNSGGAAATSADHGSPRDAINLPPIDITAPPDAGGGDGGSGGGSGGGGGGGGSSGGSGGGSSNTATLYVNFETSKKPTVSGWAYNKTVSPGPEMPSPGGSFPFDQGTTTTTGCSIPFGLLLPFYDIETTGEIKPNEGAPPGTTTGNPVKSYSDISDITLNTTGAIYSNQISVTPDTWHHVLVSVELETIATHGSGGSGAGTLSVRAATSADHVTPHDSINLPPIDITAPPDAGGGGGDGGSGGGGGDGGSGGGGGFSGNVSDYVAGSSKLFVALDDINYKGFDLGSYEKDGNGMIPDQALAVAGQSSTLDDDGNPLANPEYVLSDPAVPAGVLGIPATATYADNIHQVQMAELLMWLDPKVPFDTGVESNRRLFITKVEKDGKQHPTNVSPIYIPFERYAIGDPATWEPGADTPAFIPPLSSLDPSMIGSGNKLLHAPNVDFTKCSFNWQMGLNLGKTEGRVHREGKVKSYWPPTGSDPSVTPGSGGGKAGA